MRIDLASHQHKSSFRSQINILQKSILLLKVSQKGNQKIQEVNTESKVVQASVMHELIDEHPFFFFDAAA